MKAGDCNFGYVINSGETLQFIALQEVAFYFVVLFSGNLSFMKIASYNSHRDEIEINSDKLSAYSCSDSELPDSDSNYSAKSDIFSEWKRHCTNYFPNGDSVGGENDSDIEYKLNYDGIDVKPTVTWFLNEENVKVLPSDYTNIILFYGGVK